MTGRKTAFIYPLSHHPKTVAVRKIARSLQTTEISEQDLCKPTHIKCIFVRMPNRSTRAKTIIMRCHHSVLYFSLEARDTIMVFCTFHGRPQMPSPWCSVLFMGGDQRYHHAVVYFSWAMPSWCSVLFMGGDQRYHHAVVYFSWETSDAITVFCTFHGRRPEIPSRFSVLAMGDQRCHHGALYF